MIPSARAAGNRRSLSPGTGLFGASAISSFVFGSAGWSFTAEACRARAITPVPTTAITPTAMTTAAAFFICDLTIARSAPAVSDATPALTFMAAMSLSPVSVRWRKRRSIELSASDIP
jgi:hypothetical protein